MHDALKSSSGYHKELDEALNDEFLRRTLDTFAVAYRANREAVFKEVDEKALIKQIADAKEKEFHVDPAEEHLASSIQHLGKGADRRDFS